MAGPCFEGMSSPVALGSRPADAAGDGVSVSRQAPAEGWLRQVRLARGVTQQALADALGCKRQACAQLERSEARGAISLYSLRKAAAAMDCELVYALVPRGAAQAVNATAKEPEAERPWVAGEDLPTNLL